jgi:hypothetical protein
VLICKKLEIRWRLDERERLKARNETNETNEINEINETNEIFGVILGRYTETDCSDGGTDPACCHLS